MKKRNILHEKSKCVFSDDIDVAQPLTPAALARIAGVDRSGINRAVNGGSLNSIGGKIPLSDLKNTIWLTRRLTAELTIMDTFQRDQASRLLKELENLPGTTAPAPAAKPGKAPAAPARRIEKYSPAKLKRGNFYYVGTMGSEGRLVALVGIYLDQEYSGIDVEPLVSGLSLAIDSRGRLEGIRANDDIIENLFFI